MTKESMTLISPLVEGIEQSLAYVRFKKAESIVTIEREIVTDRLTLEWIGIDEGRLKRPHHPLP